LLFFRAFKGVRDLPERAAGSFQYGGQAVIEGVMMRGPSSVAVAVRAGDEIIVDREEYTSWADTSPGLRFLKWPLVRGTVVLFESMVMGVRALNQSASLALGEEEGEGLSGWDVFLAVALAFVVGIALFILFPAWLGHITRIWGLNILGQNIVEGVTRLAIFLGYLLGIRCFKDIRRVFQYHGAEHKVINAFEDGADLTVTEAAKRSRMHPSCGTSFLLVVLVISIVIFALVGNGPWWYRFGSRIVLLPVIAGLGYEVIRYARLHRHSLCSLLIVPGLWLQNLTTGEPDAGMLEVAISAFRSVCIHL
jgi:uncharacterized protein YqhQ